MSTPTPHDPEQTPSYPPPPAPPYAAPPAYQSPQYPGAPQYPGTPGAAPQYPGAAPQYPGAAPQYTGYPYGAYPTVKTNTLAILALIGAILGFIWVLPIIGSLAGAIMGHISLNQIKRSGEKGRGMAMAGVIVGWVGLGLVILGAIAFFGFFLAVASAPTTGYGA